MKKKIIYIVLLFLFSINLSAKFDQDLKKRVERFLIGKNFAVLLTDKVPTLNKKSSLFRKGVTIESIDGGKLQKTSFMGMERKTDSFLNIYQLLEILKIKITNKTVIIRTMTFNKLKKRGENYSHHWTSFKFIFSNSKINTNSDDNFGFISSSLGRHFKFFATAQAAQRYIERTRE